MKTNIDISPESYQKRKGFIVVNDPKISEITLATIYGGIPCIWARLDAHGWYVTTGKTTMDREDGLFYIMSNDERIKKNRFATWQEARNNFQFYYNDNQRTQQSSPIR